MNHGVSVCVELLFREFGEPMSLEQLRAVKAAGFDQVEFWSWRNKDVNATRNILADLDLSAVSMVSQPAGSLVDPNLHNAFLTGVRASIPIACQLGIPNLVVVAGPARHGISDAEQSQALSLGLRQAAPMAEDAGITLALEPWNSRIDHVGSFLDSTNLALDVVEEVNSPAVRVLYDVYHSVVMGEDPGTVLQGRGHLVAHAQIADYPGRHEPGSGSIPWEHILLDLRKAGYSGGIGLEYIPSQAGTFQSLEYIGGLLRGN